MSILKLLSVFSACEALPIYDHLDFQVTRWDEHVKLNVAEFLTCLGATNTSVSLYYAKQIDQHFLTSHNGFGDGNVNKLFKCLALQDAESGSLVLFGDDGLQGGEFLYSNVTSGVMEWDASMVQIVPKPLDDPQPGQ